MKRCLKLPEPQALINYRNNQPHGTWEGMQADAFFGGMQAYRDIKPALVRGQRCLCAYCEQPVAEGTTDAQIESNRPNQRVEHFHPKSDLINRPPNWALHWPNLWAVCHGGSNQDRAMQQHLIFPLPENLSCDAFKDHQINAGRLPANPEGFILAPDQIPAFPLLFKFAPDGAAEADPVTCAVTSIPNNRQPDTSTLVAQTIEHLNLSCTRLKRNRAIAKAQLEKRITQARAMSQGAPAQSVLLNLARRLFSNNANNPWPEFFSLLRWRLGSSAEQHLQQIGYQG